MPEEKGAAAIGGQNGPEPSGDIDSRKCEIGKELLTLFDGNTTEMVEYLSGKFGEGNSQAASRGSITSTSGITLEVDNNPGQAERNRRARTKLPVEFIADTVGNHDGRRKRQQEEHRLLTLLKQYMLEIAIKCDAKVALLVMTEEKNITPVNGPKGNGVPSEMAGASPKMAGRQTHHQVSASPKAGSTTELSADHGYADLVLAHLESIELSSDRHAVQNYTDALVMAGEACCASTVGVPRSGPLEPYQVSRAQYSIEIEPEKAAAAEGTESVGDLGFEFLTLEGKLLISGFTESAAGCRAHRSLFVLGDHLISYESRDGGWISLEGCFSEKDEGDAIATIMREATAKDGLVTLMFECVAPDT
jgi:hypothetical protein